MTTLLFAVIALLVGQASAPAVYMSNAELVAALNAAGEKTPAMATAPVRNTDRYRINLVRRTTPQGAIMHNPGSEVHHIVDGAATLVTGGTLVRPAGGGSATIEGGESRRVQKGDVILIPAGTPHWYKDVEGSITYLEVRFGT